MCILVPLKARLGILFLFLISSFVHAQKDTLPYDRTEEILDKGKRYAFHNNYLTGGFGFSGTKIRDVEQATLGIDFVFHIKRQHFQAGVLMSGNEFRSNNNLSGHLCYGYRIENHKSNIAFFAGISQNKGAIPAHIDQTDTIPVFYYRNTGLYANISYVHKLTYDIGIGLEAHVEINKTQVFAGIKGIVFFSGAYRGKAKVFNRRVNPKRK